MMALSGVRSSCDMLARNSDLWRLTTSSSRKSRAFWMARADWVAKVFSKSTTSGANTPGVFRFTTRPPMSRFSRSSDVGDLDRLVGLGEPAHGPLALEDARCAPGLHQLLVHALLGPQLELTRRLVVLVDGVAVRAGELGGSGHDRRENRVQIQRRADSLAHLAERSELVHRAGELTRPRLELREEANVLDGDHRLVGEGLQQLDLVLGEWPGLRAGHHDDAHGCAFPQHWNKEEASTADRASQPVKLVLRIHLDIGYVN